MTSVQIFTELVELLPSINQLDLDNLVNLKKLGQHYQRQETVGRIKEDEDIPELVEGENFEDALTMYPKVAGTAIPHTHTLPLSNAEVIRKGSDIMLVELGVQLAILEIGSNYGGISDRGLAKTK